MENINNNQEFFDDEDFSQTIKEEVEEREARDSDRYNRWIFEQSVLHSE
jgi:hypothetical protein